MRYEPRTIEMTKQQERLLLTAAAAHRADHEENFVWHEGFSLINKISGRIVWTIAAILSAWVSIPS